MYSVSQFDADGNYSNNYNGTAVKDNMTGLVDDNGNTLLNTYSNYNDGVHGTGFLEVNIIRELGANQGYITSDMIGTYRFSVTAKSPAENNCGGTNADGATGGNLCRGGESCS